MNFLSKLRISHVKFMMLFKINLMLDKVWANGFKKMLACGQFFMVKEDSFLLSNNFLFFDLLVKFFSEESLHLSLVLLSVKEEHVVI
jgi:hypothetical protein